MTREAAAEDPLTEREVLFVDYSTPADRELTPVCG
jgi:hypothetical protein